MEAKNPLEKTMHNSFNLDLIKPHDVITLYDVQTRRSDQNLAITSPQNDCLTNPAMRRKINKIVVASMGSLLMLKIEKLVSVQINTSRQIKVSSNIKEEEETSYVVC